MITEPSVASPDAAGGFPTSASANMKHTAGWTTDVACRSPAEGLYACGSKQPPAIAPPTGERRSVGGRSRAHPLESGDSPYNSLQGTGNPEISKPCGRSTPFPQHAEPASVRSSLASARSKFTSARSKIISCRSDLASDRSKLTSDRHLVGL